MCAFVLALEATSGLVLRNFDEFQQMYSGTSTLVGKGNFGSVNIGTRISTGETVAIKTTAFYRNEVAALLQLQHEHIITVYDIATNGTSCLIAMEYASKFGALLNLGNSPVKNASTLQNTFLELAKTVKYIHSNGWNHRDLYVNNLVRANDGKVKIIDFGIAVPYRDSGRHDDIWKLGQSMLILAMNRVVWNHVLPGDKRNKLYEVLDRKSSCPLATLLRSMLGLNRKTNTMTIDDVLNHEYFKTTAINDECEQWRHSIANFDKP